MREVYSDEEGLIGKYRIPLDTKRALMIAAQVTEYPEHVITVEPPFLVLRFP